MTAKSVLASVVFATQIVFAVHSRAADTAPHAAEAVVNLLVGHCMSEKLGIGLAPGSINPHAIGTPIADGHDRRLSKHALRIPTVDGAVYYDHDEAYCYVHASGTDAVFTASSLQDAIGKLAIKTIGQEDGQGKDESGVLKRAVVYILQAQTDDPRVVVVTIFYPLDDPSILTAGVTLARKQ